MIAFHFPPISGSSGFLRTTCFARYIQKLAWEPIVLTASTRAYPNVEPDNSDLARNLEVYRTFALDAKRHLAWRGKFFRFTALPDQWSSWTISGVLRGLIIVSRKKPSLVWSTFPIPTALTIGYYVSRFTGLPWVVDVRDVILDDDFPESKSERRIYAKIERRVARFASALVVTTENAAAMYAERFPELAEKIHVIRNGFDEEVFGKIESCVPKNVAADSRIRLLHSGLLSPTDRNPIPFFDALVRLRSSNQLNAEKLTIDFRACGNESEYRVEVRNRGLSDIVRFLPPVSYSEAVAEMMTADGLLLFQGRTCNHAVPAKVYEYLRCGLPIFVATDPSGETAGTLSGLGCDVVADIDSESDLAKRFSTFVAAIDRGDAFVPAKEDIMKFSRQEQARALGALFNRVAG